jgi:light-regulated signal transduction histidine kinase (bacteriophytochrome)
MPDSIDLDRALEACAREPIHIPGAIQPHGVLLVLDQTSQEISHAAGDVAGLLGVGSWQGRSLGAVLGDAVAERVAVVTHSSVVGGYVGRVSGPGGPLDLCAHVSGAAILLEAEPAMEPALPAALLLGQLEAAAAAFERAQGVKALCERAAVEFQRLTGFDRVMIYRFLDEGAGTVLAECVTGGLPSFLNHHFPGSDIPAQARALYVRNLVRAIPDVAYQPAPVTPAWTAPEPLDMSDSVLRSVSPVHMQYLRNMGVGASASISIVKDGVLWGLVACHHATPRLMPYDIRAAARALAGVLARQVRAKEDAESYRERMRLRGLEDEVSARFAGLGGVEANLPASLDELRRLLDADGVAAVRGEVVIAKGTHPPEAAVRELAARLLGRGDERPFATDRLSELVPEAAAYRAGASGLLGVVVSAEEPFVLLWFRAEQVELVNWAGNPHKAAELQPGERLTPRASFDAWRETVRGRSRPWSLAEADAAQRLKGVLVEQRGQRRLRELNARLSEAVSEKDGLLQQKEMLLKEVNHRIQNSLQLVSSFLSLQAKASGDPVLTAAFDEARQRLSAVALVHRRLYRADQIETVDLARYLEDLAHEMGRSMGAEWADSIQLDADPVLIHTDRAVTLGLVVTELVINANKYAYGGAPGPVEIRVEGKGGRLRIAVADHGRGKARSGEGFGSRMMAAMVRQLHGEMTYEDNRPGLRAVLSVPLSARDAAPQLS